MLSFLPTRILYLASFRAYSCSLFSASLSQLTTRKALCWYLSTVAQVLVAIVTEPSGSDIAPSLISLFLVGSCQLGIISASQPSVAGSSYSSRAIEADQSSQFIAD